LVNTVKEHMDISHFQNLREKLEAG
jgi:hypothetical protein